MSNDPQPKLNNLTTNNFVETNVLPNLNEKYSFTGDDMP